MTSPPSLTSASDAEFVAEGLKRGIFTKTRMTLVGSMYDLEVNRLISLGARFITSPAQQGTKSDMLIRGAEVYVLTYEEPDDPRAELGYTPRG